MNLRRYFFFSSRRRHTSSKRDWSSDVCSSDLSGHSLWLRGLAAGKATVKVSAGGKSDSAEISVRARRSEERRVGKECRGRRARESRKERPRALSRRSASERRAAPPQPRAAPTR